jgi:NDP-sugar pyrophosphorylase family protein
MTGCAIILAGGRGSRLGALTEHTPKPLLRVAGRPFLFHILDYLIRQKVRRVILATGHFAEQIEDAVGSVYQSLTISYSREAAPLGTGGAIALALTQADSPDVLVLNGDTYFPADLASLASVHAARQATLSVILRKVVDVSRYGHMSVSQGLVTAMHEKGAIGPGLINGGIYLTNRAAFLADAPEGPFSLERELLPRWISRQAVACTVADEYFIDIGIPADLTRAETELRSGFKPVATLAP